MTLLQLFLVNLVIFLPGSGSVEVEVLEPIRMDGDEVGLIFIPERYMRGDQYRKTAQAIQEASELRVWVVLTFDYQVKVADIAQMRTAIKDAVDALTTAGMTSTNYVGVTHGFPAYFLQRYAQDSEDLKAIILLGACLARTTKLQDYPLPVLTLGAELDGITRITRVAEEYAKLKQELKTSFLALYKTPVILIEGGNHAQFASGKMPFILSDEDLTPALKEEEAHVQIAKHVNSFITATFVSSIDMKDTALEELEEAFLNADKKFQPFLYIKELDEKDGFSQWTVLAQEHFAQEFAHQIQIENEIGDEIWFFRSSPSIRVDKDRVIVKTTSLLDYKEHNMLLVTAMESPIEINMKLKSKDAIWKAVVKQNNSSHLDGPKLSLKAKPNTCKSLNEYALDLALKLSSPAARDRYKAQGRPMIFEDDNVVSFGFLWALTPLKTSEDADGLHVKAIARVTPASGLHYCKVITPYRAMEWINIDSLRKD